MSPWRSKALKLRPLRRYFRSIYGKDPICQLVAVRKNESARRKKIYDFSKEHKYNPISNPEYFLVRDSEYGSSYKAFPIINWSDDDVKTFLHERGFQIMKQYEDFGVSGCYWCPFYQRGIYERILRVYPDIYDEIIALEEELGKPSVSGKKFLGDIKANMYTTQWLEK